MVWESVQVMWKRRDAARLLPIRGDTRDPDARIFTLRDISGVILRNRRRRVAVVAVVAQPARDATAACTGATEVSSPRRAFILR